MRIGNLEITGFAALAPMAGVADRAMREICKEAGAAYTVGELTSAKGISLGSKKSSEYLETGDKERPFGSQIFGCEPEIMAEAAKTAESFGPDFIDINMGCPAPKIALSSKGGSALLKDPELVGRIVEAVSNAVKIPVTVKIRTGWDENSINAPEIAKICEQNGAAAITVHGRTRMQMYTGKANLDVIKQVKESVKIPVIANGDVTNPLEAKQMYEKTGCDFIMIGRGSMGRPWVFTEINKYLSEGILLPEPTLEEKLSVMKKHIERIVLYKNESVAMREARKHAAWYIKGIKGAASLRAECMSLERLSDLDFLIEKALELNK